MMLEASSTSEEKQSCKIFSLAFYYLEVILNTLPLVFSGIHPTEEKMKIELNPLEIWFQILL